MYVPNHFREDRPDVLHEAVRYGNIELTAANTGAEVGALRASLIDDPEDR